MEEKLSIAECGVLRALAIEQHDAVHNYENIELYLFLKQPVVIGAVKGKTSRFIDGLGVVIDNLYDPENNVEYYPMYKSSTSFVRNINLSRHDGVNDTFRDVTYTTQKEYTQMINEDVDSYTMHDLTVE